MESGEGVELSDEQKQDLRREMYIAEVLKIRAGYDRGERKKNWVFRLLETSGGAALVTVLLGGVLGAALNFVIQADLKQREDEQARQKFKGELALMSYKNYLEQRQGAMKSLYELVGRTTSSCYTLISRMGPEYDPRLSPSSKEKLVAENQQIYKKFQEAQDEWRGNRDSLGLLVNFYYEGDSGVMQCWSNTRGAADKYAECADSKYRTYITDYITHSPEEICKGERAAFEAQISEFTQCIQRVNKYLWKDYYPENAPPAVSK